MKNNLLFLLVLVALFLTAMGALYYQYRFGEFAQLEEVTTEIEVVEETPAPETVEPEAELSPAPDEELEAQPTLSADDDLETIQTELEQTEILEEDFSDL